MQNIYYNKHTSTIFFDAEWYKQSGVAKDMPNCLSYYATA